MTDGSRHHVVFVVRIWTEAQSSGPGARRGYVEHVASGERHYFALLDEAFAFVDALTRPDTGSSAAHGHAG
jgi:hypothetical protein